MVCIKCLQLDLLRILPSVFSLCCQRHKKQMVSAYENEQNQEEGAQVGRLDSFSLILIEVLI